MAKSYSHSRVFETLKGTKEVISDNLTSLQYLQTLDMFLWNALIPIQAECPSLFKNYLAKVIAYQTLKSSRKLTSLTKEEKPNLAIHLFNMLTAPDAKKANEHARSMHVNRGIWFGLISMFLRDLERYERLHSPALTIETITRVSAIQQIEESVGLRHGSNLYAVIQQVRYWDGKARYFKEVILQKYTRMTLLQAKSTYTAYNHFIELDDVSQTYMVTASRAIDRCDARQGVLTTFLQNWFKSAKSEVGELAKGQSDMSIEALTETHGDSVSDIIGYSMPNYDESELIEHIAFVSKQIDPQGLIRGSLHIPEYVTDEQERLLERFAFE